MFYTIYKITNKINNKIYIGKHQTKELNDDYMGSGKHLKYAINKYGIENFIKEILFQFDNETDMNAKESELVTEEFCLREDTYNICVGGQGGFSHINRDKEFMTEYRIKGGKKAGHIRAEKLKNDENYRSHSAITSTSNLIKARENYTEKYPKSAFFNKTHSEETKKLLSDKAKLRTTNSQSGTVWITNGQENKKIKKDVDIIPEGWYNGRVIKNMP